MRPFELFLLLDRRDLQALDLLLIVPLPGLRTAPRGSGSGIRALPQGREGKRVGHDEAPVMRLVALAKGKGTYPTPSGLSAALWFQGHITLHLLAGDLKDASRHYARERKDVLARQVIGEHGVVARTNLQAMGGELRERHPVMGVTPNRQHAYPGPESDELQAITPGIVAECLLDIAQDRNGIIPPGGRGTIDFYHGLQYLPSEECGCRQRMAIIKGRVIIVGCGAVT